MRIDSPFPTTRPGRWEPYVQLGLSTLLMISSGSSYALSVFTPFVEAGARPIHSLNGVWEAAMGTMHFASAPAMILAAVYLDDGKSDNLTRFTINTKTFRLRMLCLLSLASYIFLLASSAGARTSSAWLLFLGVAIQAFPLAVVYLVSIESAIAWFPHFSRPIVGLAEFTFGFGVVILTCLFSWLIKNCGHEHAIAYSSLALTAMCIPPTLYMKWPSSPSPFSSVVSPQGTDMTSDETQPINQQNDNTSIVGKLHWYDAIKMPNFWYYAVSIFTTGAPYMLNPYFFKVGLLYHASFDSLVSWFYITTLLALVVGMGGTTATHVLGFGTGYWFSGAKNLSMVLMVIQIGSMLALIYSSSNEVFWMYLLIKFLTKIIAVCHVGNAAILARDLFGEQNGTLVFGLGAGIALGSGEGVSALIMAGMEKAQGLLTRPADYNSFYWVAVVWSTIGLIGLAATFRQTSEVFAVQKRELMAKYNSMPAV